MSKFTFDSSKFPKISEANKELDYFTKLPYNEDNIDHMSEWAIAVAASNFKHGQVITEVEFLQECNNAIILQTLQKMEMEGLIYSAWVDSPDGGYIGWYATGTNSNVLEKLKDKSALAKKLYKPPSSEQNRKRKKQ